MGTFFGYHRADGKGRQHVAPCLAVETELERVAVGQRTEATFSFSNMRRDLGGSCALQHRAYRYDDCDHHGPRQRRKTRNDNDRLPPGQADFSVGRRSQSASGQHDEMWTSLPGVRTLVAFASSEKAIPKMVHGK
jgi:hypothetical protein